MAGFIMKSACHGRNPGNGSPHRHIMRPDLCARLLRERHVARFIVAPGGFGKSELALEYADTVFSFRHVFWINGKSPCFLRDLDAGTIAVDCLGYDADAELVVFDDLPVFETSRAAALSHTIDVLLEQGVEVIVTCTPTADAYGQLHRDRVRIGTSDLLLTDEELKRTASEPAVSPQAAASRICGLAWGVGEEVERRFLADVIADEPPADCLLAAVAMLVTLEGTIAGIDAGLTLSSDELRALAEDYPFLGIDEERETYDAYRFEPSDIRSALGRRLDALVLCSASASRDELVSSWARRLVNDGRGGRACATMSCFCTQKSCAQWAADQGMSILLRGDVLPLHRLLVRSREARTPVRAWCAAQDALCRSLLGDGSGALPQAKRLAFDAAQALHVRALSLYVVARAADGELAAAACEEAGRLAAACEGTGAAHGADAQLWAAFLRLVAMRRRGVAALAALWDDPSFAQGADERIRACAAAFLARDVERAGAQATSDEDVKRALSAVASFVFPQVEREGARAGLLVCQAASVLERLHAADPELPRPALSPEALLALRGHEMDMLRQRQGFIAAEQDAQTARSEKLATHPDSYLSGRTPEPAPADDRHAPQVHVRLFGRLEVSLGGTLLDADLFDNQRAGELLAILTLNKGREMTRDSLAAELWSDNVRSAATKNFYNVWARLRTALTLPDGSCPYLIKRRNGYSLDERLVSSDVDRFDQVCRTLAFGQVDVGEWGELYREVEERFSCDLLPIEERNPAIVQMRADMRSRLIDALSIASQRLVAAGEAQWGIWFARMAYQRDVLREDAAMTLMEAQIAAGQRTSALMTYLECKRSLSSELGIDPSRDARDLYESLLEDR